MTNNAETNIPDFVFYGESNSGGKLEKLHCEPLVVRSKSHHWKIRPHRHSSIIQIFCVLSGGASAQIDSKELRLKSPCLLIVPAGCVHAFNWSTTVNGYVLSLSTSYFQHITQHLENTDVVFSNTYSISDKDGVSVLGRIFENIFVEYTNKYKDRSSMIEALLTSAIILVLRSAKADQFDSLKLDRGYVHFSKFLQCIEDNLDKHLSVAEYSNLLGLTPSHLNNLCRKHQNVSALSVIHNRMLIEAKRQLIYTGKTVSEISWHLGYSSPSQFTRFFKRYTSSSPREFKDSGIFD
jgi:AraC family transcriptional activator of pobA